MYAQFRIQPWKHMLIGSSEEVSLQTIGRIDESTVNLSLLLQSQIDH